MLFRSSGIWQEGEEIIGALPFASTTKQYREITRVVRDKTSGPGRLFYYDATADALTDCAVYDPSDTTPEFRFTKIRNMNHFSCCQCANGSRSVSALVKLQFIPVENDNDLVLIENLDAIGNCIQGIRKSDSGDSQGGEGDVARAVHELNLELRNRFPISQTPISIRPSGAIGAFRARLGMI